MTTKQDLDAKKAETAFNQALAYVWGRQDAGESEHDSGVSFVFAKAFKARRIAFDTEQVSFMPNLRDAFTQWTESGEIQ